MHSHIIVCLRQLYGKRWSLVVELGAVTLFACYRDALYDLAAPHAAAGSDCSRSVHRPFTVAP
jgi:hypothetical protein